MIERDCVGIGCEGSGWRGERATVADDARDTNFIDPSAKRRIFGTGIVFFGADHEERDRQGTGSRARRGN
jgi:hypothetical protein